MSRTVRELFDFLRGRPTLRRVLLLLDARIETKTNDRQAMRLLNDAGLSVDDAFARESADQTYLRGTRDFAEGVSAFIEKRTPRFVGE